KSHSSSIARAASRLASWVVIVTRRCLSSCTSSLRFSQSTKERARPIALIRLSISAASLPGPSVPASRMPSFLRRTGSVAACATNNSASASAPSAARASGVTDFVPVMEGSLEPCRPAVELELAGIVAKHPAIRAVRCCRLDFQRHGHLGAIGALQLRDRGVHHAEIVAKVGELLALLTYGASREAALQR